MPGRNGGTLKRGGSKGRPKGSVSVTTILKRLLDERTEDGRTNAERVAAGLIEQAARGNVHAFRELMNRVEGPVQTKLDVSELTDDQLIMLLERYGLADPKTVNVVFEDA